jgi:hypothetical protein
MIPYHQLIDFRLPMELESQLSHLNWQALTVASTTKKKDWIRMAYSRKILFELVKYYGWRCQSIGTLLSFKLSIDLENTIRANIDQRYGNQIATEAIIRLQVIFGGEIIPIHTDIARESSIVYPISHPYASKTQFYNSNRTGKCGLIPPSWCTLANSISIDNNPVLLDVSVPHAIVYSKNIYTKKVPRISLSLKFKNLNFQSVVELTK